MNNIRVLIVDDNAGIVDMLAHFLERKGYQTGRAFNGMEALKRFAKNHFDVVLTDWQMPVMDGLSLASEVKKLRPDTVVVMMTGSAEIDMPKDNAVDHLLEKPFNLKDINAMLACAQQTATNRYCLMDKRVEMRV